MPISSEKSTFRSETQVNCDICDVFAVCGPFRHAISVHMGVGPKMRLPIGLLGSGPCGQFLPSSIDLSFNELAI